MPKNHQELMNIEHRFESFLPLIGIKKEELAPMRLIELKAAFMGGLSSGLVGLTVDMEGLSEQDSVNMLQHMIIQLDKFWLKTENPYPDLMKLI